MAWSETFKNFLRLTTDDDNNMRSVYAPRFRLIMGSPGANHPDLMGWWEQKSTPRTLEIGTHPNTSSFFNNAGILKDGEVRGYPYLWTTGLISFTMGPQQINPRTHVYSGQTLNVRVTQFVDACVSQMPVGTMCRLQVNFDRGLFGEDVGEGKHWADEMWQNIGCFIFKNRKFDGTNHLIEFGMGLEAARCHYRAQGRYPDATVDPFFMQWFPGTGEQTTTRATVTDFSDSVVDTNFLVEADPTITGNKERWNRTGVDVGDYWPNYLYAYGYSSKASHKWIKVKNTSSKDTYFSYTGVAPDFADTGFLTLRFTGVNSVSTDTYEFPGMNGHAGGEVAGGIGSGSKLTNVCVISGTPVTVLVNSLYISGFHSDMVPGLFGFDASALTDSSLINGEDCTKANEQFNEMWVSYVATTDFEPDPVRDSPFVKIIDKPVSDGLSMLSKSAGKWGVFPRWKEDGYGIGVRTNGSLASVNEHYGGAVEIDMRDIEGCDFSQQDSQQLGSYHGAEVINKDIDNPSSGANHRVTKSGVGGEMYDASTRNNYPIIPTLLINASECAAGWDNNVSRNFGRYITGGPPGSGKSLLGAMYVYSHKTVTFRLRGLKYAHIAPGDYVSYLPEIAEAGGVAPGGALPSDSFAWGPLSARVWTTGNLIPELAEEAWFVVSSHVDWIGCRVVLKVIHTNYSPTADWGRFTDSSRTDRKLSSDMDLPHTEWFPGGIFKDTDDE